jgi:hypothetical protein
VFPPSFLYEWSGGKADKNIAYGSAGSYPLGFESSSSNEVFSDVVSIRSWAYLPIHVAKLGGKGHEVAIYRVVLRARPDVATSQQILANQGGEKGSGLPQ